MTSALDVFVIVAAIAVGAFVKGATGGGLPLIAIPVMAVFLGVERSVVVMAIPGVVANTWMIWTHRETVSQTRDLPVLVGTCIVGAVAGTLLLESLPARVLSAILAAVIGAYIVLAILKPGYVFSPRFTRVASPPVGIVAGGMQGATGISGPLLSTYLHGYGLPPRAYVFSLSVLFFVSAFVQVIALAAVGLYTEARLWESALALVPIALALPLGTRAARRLSPLAFQRVVLVLLAASAITLVYNAVGGTA
jgi:uncharacterized membrane protein YfcA